MGSLSGQSRCEYTSRLPRRSPSHYTCGFQSVSHSRGLTCSTRLTWLQAGGQTTITSIAGEFTDLQRELGGGTHVPECVCGGQRTPWVPALPSHHRTSCLFIAACNRPSAPLLPGILASVFLAQCENWRNTSAPSFTRLLRIQTRALVLAWQMLYPPDHLSSLRSGSF